MIKLLWDQPQGHSTESLLLTLRTGTGAFVLWETAFQSPTGGYEDATYTGQVGEFNLPLQQLWLNESSGRVDPGLPIRGLESGAVFWIEGIYPHHAMCGEAEISHDITLGVVVDYGGFFLNDDGMPSSTKHIQDSYYYQQFSYVLESDRPLDDYEALVKQHLHPLGLKLFGSWQPRPNVGRAATLNMAKRTATRAHTLPGGAQAVSVRKVSQPLVHEAATSLKLGASLRTVTQQLMHSLPSAEDDQPVFADISQVPDKGLPASQSMEGPNEEYWHRLANTQLKDLTNFTVGDLVDKQWQRSNLQPDIVRITYEPNRHTSRLQVSQFEITRNRPKLVICAAGAQVSVLPSAKLTIKDA